MSAAAILYVMRSVDLERAGAVLAGADWRWLLAAFGIVPALMVLRGWRWQQILPVADAARPSVPRVLVPLLVGNLANLVLPARAGDPLRAYLLARRERMRFSGTLGSLALERAMDLATLAVIGLPAAVAANAVGWMVSGLALLAVGGVVLTALLVSPLVRHAVSAIAARPLISRRRVTSRGVGVVLSFSEGARGSGKRRVIGAIALSGLTWVVVAIAIWLAARSLSISLDPAGAVVVAALTSLGTAIPSAPAAIGTYELAAVVAGHALGVANAEALALGLVAHAVTTLPFVAAGGAALGLTSLGLGDIANGRAVQQAEIRLRRELG